MKCLGQLYITVTFPSSEVPHVRILSFQGGKWKFVPILEGASQGHDPARDSAPSQPCPQSPACASGQRLSCWKKRGTIPVFKSVFSTERSSTWITEQLGVCQVFCAFYCPRKSDLSKCKQKTGHFNQTTFTIVKFRWDHLHEKIRTSKCYHSSLKLTLTQNLFFFF